jgi:hypothetical protein
VSWLQDARAFQPDLIFDEVLDTIGIGAREPDGRSGDLPSVSRTAGELRRAGFSDAQAEGDMLEHRFSVDGYLNFLSEFDEESLFDELDRKEREQVLSTMRRRLSALPAAAMTMRFPIVFASGRRSDR